MTVQLTKPTIQNQFRFEDDFLDELVYSGGRNKFFDLAAAACCGRNGRSVYILQNADLMNATVYESTDIDGYRYAHTVRWQLNDKAFEAYKNLSGDENFVGDVYEFAEELVGYAELFQAALIDAEICPIEPYATKMRDYPVFGNGWTDSLPLEHRRPSLESILKWAADTSTYYQLFSYLYDQGIDSMLAAYKAGVPVEDIIA
jgi:hypothetical protein